MNKKIILGLGATALLASSVFAFNGQGNMKKGCSQKSSQHKMMMKKGGNYKKDGRIVKMIMRLDLNDEQKAQIENIMQDSMKNMPNPYDAFTKSGFDKVKFVKLSKERKDGGIDRKAETISKIYAVLNSSQKKDLKTMLDMREIMKKKMTTRKMTKKMN